MKTLDRRELVIAFLVCTVAGLAAQLAGTPANLDALSGALLGGCSVLAALLVIGVLRRLDQRSRDT
jgi:hypothetical protein